MLHRAMLIGYCLVVIIVRSIQSVFSASVLSSYDLSFGTCYFDAEICITAKNLSVSSLCIVSDGILYCTAFSCSLGLKPLI
jgi:hypothetical protein